MEQNELDHIILEYNPKQAKSGGFHYNIVRNNRVQWTPDLNGWHSVANTLETKASAFCDIIIGENDRRMRGGKSPLTVQEVKMKWKEYSYIYNTILTRPINEWYAKIAKDKFKSATALARLGNGHFADEEEFNDSNYDPMSFIEANF